MKRAAHVLDVALCDFSLLASLLLSACIVRQLLELRFFFLPCARPLMHDFDSPLLFAMLPLMVCGTWLMLSVVSDVAFEFA